MIHYRIPYLLTPKVCHFRALSYKLRTFAYPNTSINDHLIDSLTRSPVKSVILASTPDQLHIAHSRAQLINKYDSGIQLIVAAFDTVGQNSLRSGVSEVWLDDFIEIRDVKFLDIGSSKDWRHKQGKFNLSVSDSDTKYDVEVELANTMFTNGDFETLYINQPKKLPFHECSNSKLKEISLQLPNIPKIKPIHYSSLQKLPITEQLIITDTKHNMIKEINNQPASSILQLNDELMSMMTKETKVYAVISKDGVERRYEVVGGGGSWGPKLKLLALKPESDMFIPEGADVVFYYLSGQYRYEVSQLHSDTGFIFECSLEQVWNNDVKEVSHLGKWFGVGSEKGVVINGIRYDSHGELISLTV